MLPGPTALTEFEAARLLARLRKIDSGVSQLSAQYIYLLGEQPGVLGDETKLPQLLELGPPLPEESCLWIGPRVGTQSPWSSKATDILKNTGFASIARTERARVVQVTGARDLAVLADSLHDRMTEAVFFGNAEELLSLFLARQNKPLMHINVLELGAKAIQEADTELGLSLTPDEVAYLVAEFTKLGRNPTDVELYMFAQANSEHCRHKIFNAQWKIDGVVQDKSLFAMIRNTNERGGDNVLSAYRDNAAVIRGWTGSRYFPDAEDRAYRAHVEEIDILMKVETHNHPTAISPWPGAATGAGGEIRDEGATGRGAKPKAGLSGFTVSHLRLPQAPQPWEAPESKPSHIASPLDIMIEGPLGAAAFNNEFGRPNLCGYFRTFEVEESGQRFGYHKPIMLAGGLGNIRTEHVEKSAILPGYALICLGGPAMLIGLGGGAASSAIGTGNTELDFASVQRDNPEMERRAQEVIDRCWQLGDENPIAFIHDVGAGGLSNAFPELVKDGGLGGSFDLAAVPRSEDGLNPLELWCNESQERYVLAIAPQELARFEQICERERCPYSIVGHAEAEKHLTLVDGDDKVIELPMSVLFGNMPKVERSFTRSAKHTSAIDLSGITINDAVERLLRLPAIASKSFLITIADRTVGGLTVQDQMVGPWQVPVADCAVTLSAFDVFTGEAMAIGERTPVAVLNAAASARMAVSEAITNLASADIGSLSNIKLSANWMAAAGESGENEKLFDAVHAIGMEFCPALGITIPVGKDSMSMKTRWRDGEQEQTIVSPLSLIVSGFAPVQDVRNTLTPELKLHSQLSQDQRTTLIMIDLGEGKKRMGASSLAQVFSRNGGQCPDAPAPEKLIKFFDLLQGQARHRLHSYHDRSDGGLFVTLVEMAFAGQCGLDLDLEAAGMTDDNALSFLFNEELGAVIEVEPNDAEFLVNLFHREGIRAHALGMAVPGNDVVIRCGMNDVYRNTRSALHKIWAETSFHIQSLRDNPECAQEELRLLDEPDRPGLSVQVPFGLSTDAPNISTSRPRVAILREQGVNGQVEMAAAFDRAGFTSVDVHMSDLLSGRAHLTDFIGLAACGGFSYGDVLGAGSGWAKTILFNERLKGMFSAFFTRPDTFSLGVCNGCQMMAQLSVLIAGAETWPRFERNISARFEARLCMVEIPETNSLFLADMAGSRAPIVVSHGEGRATHANAVPSMRYIDTYGKVTQQYPLNPNGSPDGIAGVTSADGRALILMPHPERIALGVNHSWTRGLQRSPWQRIFDNARKWVG